MAEVQSITHECRTIRPKEAFVTIPSPWLKAAAGFIAVERKGKSVLV
jgi:hypothetical protein